MAETRDKNLTYRRAVWLANQPNGKNFESHLVDALNTLPTVGERRIRRQGDQFVKGMRFRTLKGGGVYGHLAAETPGDAASVLLKAHESENEGQVGTRKAGPTAEWMDGDIFFLVRNDHVLICPSGLREGVVAFFCAEMFNKAKLPETAVHFDLQRVGSADKLRMIERHGVREIELDASIYEASHRYATKERPAGMLGAAGRHIKALMGRDDAALDPDLMMKVSLRLGRKRTGAVHRAEQLGAVARGLVDSEDAYKIITKRNEVISENEITIRTRVALEKHGKSVNCDAAWQALRQWYNDLRADNFLDQ